LEWRIDLSGVAVERSCRAGAEVSDFHNGDKIGGDVSGRERAVLPADPPPATAICLGSSGCSG
jgi:hypothetical protein